MNSCRSYLVKLKFYKSSQKYCEVVLNYKGKPAFNFYLDKKHKAKLKRYEGILTKRRYINLLLFIANNLHESEFSTEYVQEIAEEYGTNNQVKYLKEILNQDQYKLFIKSINEKSNYYKLINKF